MKVLGWKIREARKRKRLSQNLLAEGICTQATISKIENRNSCESLDIFSALCSKLELTVSDCLEENFEQELERALNEADRLCTLGKPEEAYGVLSKYNLSEQLPSHFNQSKFFYYKALTNLLGKHNFEEAEKYLQQGIKVGKEVNIYNILCVNATGVSYQLQGNLNQARVYNEKAYRMLSDLPNEDLPAIACKLFYNLAKFYSSIKDYRRSVELCEEGIKLSQRKHTTLVVDYLIYEKAYNEYFLHGTIDSYKSAYYFSGFTNHEYIIECIENDMEMYNIKF